MCLLFMFIIVYLCAKIFIFYASTKMILFICNYSYSPKITLFQGLKLIFIYVAKISAYSYFKSLHQLKNLESSNYKSLFDLLKKTVKQKTSEVTSRIRN